jgi:glycosyltransferase involved in cell wall biosynthesis
MGRDPPTVLLVAESLPFPAVKGGDLRTWQHVNTVACCARVGVFGLCSNDGRRHSVPLPSLACWETSTDPALTAPPPRGVRLDARAWLLHPRGHPSDLYSSDAAAAELAGLLARLRPEIVVLEGLWLHGYLETARAAGCRVVLDCHNVEAELVEQLAGASTGADLESRVRRDVLPARTADLERRAVGGVDQLWVCSQDDARVLRGRYAPSAPIFVIPNGIQPDDYDPGAREAGEPGAPPTLVFPAFFGHPPNLIGARFLIEEVLPALVRRCGDGRLVLAGAMPPAELAAAAARDPRVVVTGAVRDIRPYLAAATAMAVPLFQGSGTRFKILEGFAAGLPVISTRKGAEGLTAREGEHLILAETADDFADAALGLAREPERAGDLARRARSYAVERHSWTAIAPRVREAIAALEA